jgi:hypothetical protein
MWPATREIDIPRLVLARPRRPSIGFLNPAPSADARLPSKVRRMSRARSPSRGSPPLTQHLAPQPEGRMTGEPDFEKVRTGGVAGGADPADHLAGAHPVSHLHLLGGLVGIPGLHAVAVLDSGEVAVGAAPAAPADGPGQASRRLPCSTVPLSVPLTGRVCAGSAWGCGTAVSRAAGPAHDCGG